ALTYDSFCGPCLANLLNAPAIVVLKAPQHGLPDRLGVRRGGVRRLHDLPSDVRCRHWLYSAPEHGYGLAVDGATLEPAVSVPTLHRDPGNVEGRVQHLDGGFYVKHLAGGRCDPFARDVALEPGRASALRISGAAHFAFE